MLSDIFVAPPQYAALAMDCMLLTPVHITLDSYHIIIIIVLLATVHGIYWSVAIFLTNVLFYNAPTVAGRHYGAYVLFTLLAAPLRP